MAEINIMYSLSTWMPLLNKNISAKDAIDKAILLEPYISGPTSQQHPKKSLVYQKNEN